MYRNDTNSLHISCLEIIGSPFSLDTKGTAVNSDELEES
jgi:hypothetical protein